MASLPNPRSFAQILGEMLETFASRANVESVKPGSPLLGIMESAAQSDARNAQDIFAVLNSMDIDRANGSVLDRIGESEEIPRQTQTYSTGVLTVIDTSIVKVSGRLWAGFAPPISGATTLYVAASSWPSTGSLYVGRGTQQVEGPIAFTAAVVASTGVYQISLSTGTTKYHAVNDEVILAQAGDRVITSGTTFATVALAGSTAVSFSSTSTAVLYDGEDTIQNVPVRCQVQGSVGNVGVGSITSTPNAPFAGCACTNPVAFTNALDTENDVQYRNRIKVARRSKSKGTIDAIQSAIYGRSASDEAATVLSSSIVRRLGLADILYIDDGTGYEPKSAGVGYESVLTVDSPPVSRFNLINSPVAKASVTTILGGPFRITPGSTLTVYVNGANSTHTFDTSQFVDTTGASAHEISSAINRNSGLLFSARTSGSGQFVTVVPIAETASIQVLDGGANSALGFPLHMSRDLFLYQNDRAFTGWTLDRNVAQVDLGSQISGSVTAGSKYTNGFIEQSSGLEGALVGKGALDGNTSFPFVSSAGQSVRITKETGEQLAKVEIGTGSFTGGTAFVNCRPGDVLVMSDAMAVTLGLTSDTAITYVDPLGAFAIVEAPSSGSSGASPHAISGQMAVMRTQAPAIRISHNAFAADTTGVGISVYSRGLMNRTATNSPVGEIAEVLVSDVPHAAEVRASSQPHFGYAISKKDSVPEFNFWRHVTSMSGSVGVPTYTEDPFATSTNKAFGVQVGRPMPYARSTSTFSYDLRQGLSYNKRFELLNTGTALNSSVDSNLFPEGLYLNYGDATGGNPQYGSLLGSLHRFVLHPKDTLGISVDSRDPELTIPTYLACNPTSSYGTTLYLKVASTGLGLDTVFGTIFDFTDFAVYQSPKGILSVLSGVGVVGSAGSVLAYGPLSGGTVSMAVAGPLGDAAPTLSVDSSSGTYIAKLHVGTAGLVSVPVPGDEAYKVGITSTSAIACKMTFRWAFKVTSAVRTSNVTVLTFDSSVTSEFNANPFSSGETAYVTLNHTGYTDSGTLHTLTPIGTTQVSFSDPGGNDTSTGLTNAWVSTSVLAPAATPYNFSALDISGTGLDWIKVSVPTAYTSLEMNDVYPVYATAAGAFSLLVERAVYPVGQVNTPTDAGPWGTWFTAYRSTTTWAGLSALNTADLGILPSSGAGYPAVKIPYDTRHEYLLGYRTAIAQPLTDEVNYIATSTWDSGNSRYNMALKAPVTSSLASYYGFSSQNIYLVPTTVQNVKDFLSASRLSGLANLATVTRTIDNVVVSSNLLGSSSGIAITGGTANATVKTLTPHPTLPAQFYVDSSDGLVGNTWVALNAPQTETKRVFGPAVTSVYVTDGQVVCTGDSSPYSGSMTGDVPNGRWSVEKHGDFGGYIFEGASIPASGFDTIQPGDWVTVNLGEGKWVPSGACTSVAAWPASVVLSNGKVVRFGGYTAGPVGDLRVYDPTSNTWSTQATSGTPPGNRIGHSMTLMPDGKILILGGSTSFVDSGAQNTAHILDPITNPATWAWIALPNIGAMTASQKLRDHQATLMDDGTVVVTGGTDETSTVSDLWHVLTYNSASPGSSTWDTGFSRRLVNARSGHTALKVFPNVILLVGGANPSAASTVEVLHTDLMASYGAQNTSIDRSYPGLVPISSSEVLIFGGTGTSNLADKIDWLTGIVSPVKPMPGGLGGDTTSYGFNVDGRVYAFGSGAVSYSPTCYIYDVASNTWGYGSSPLPWMQTVVQLKDGRFMNVGETNSLFDATVSASAANGGTFQVSRVLSDTPGLRWAFWVENPSAIHEEVSPAKMTFRRYDSVMPGDTFTVASDILGTANKGVYTVTELSGADVFYTSPSLAAIGATTLGIDAATLSVTPSSPNRLIRRLRWVGPESPSDGVRYIAKVDQVTGTYANEDHIGIGWTVESLGKLGFGTSPSYGVDAYRYHTGLVKEVNRIVYGDPADRATHPGVIAAGTELNIEGPRVKQVKVSLQIRTDQGPDVVSSVRSAVTKAINETAVGASIALSDIVSAANGVPGVLSVAMLAPAYSSTSDQILLNSDEKALVLDSTADISVTILGV